MGNIKGGLTELGNYTLFAANGWMQENIDAGKGTMKHFEVPYSRI